MLIVTFYLTIQTFSHSCVKRQKVTITFFIFNFVKKKKKKKGQNWDVKTKFSEKKSQLWDINLELWEKVKIQRFKFGIVGKSQN